MANFFGIRTTTIGKGGAKRLAKYFRNDIVDFFDCLNTNHDFTQIEDLGKLLQMN